MNVTRLPIAALAALWLFAASCAAGEPTAPTPSPTNAETPGVSETPEPTPEPTPTVSVTFPPVPTPTPSVEPTPTPRASVEGTPSPEKMLLGPRLDFETATWTDADGVIDMQHEQVVWLRAHSAKLSFKADAAAAYLTKPVVIWLVPKNAAVSFAIPADGRVIGQRGQTFSPALTVLMIGQSLAFDNDDTVVHEVHSSTPGFEFAIPDYPPGDRREHVFDKAGVVELGCAIHAQMHARIVVVHTPLSLTTSTTGRGKGTTGELYVPEGEWTVAVWHERLKFARQDIVVTAGDDRQIEVRER
jgi:plastocyanin